MRQSAPSTLAPEGLPVAAHPAVSAPASVPDPVPVPASGPAPSPVPDDTVDYPCSDGQPMAESRLHVESRGIGSGAADTVRCRG